MQLTANPALPAHCIRCTGSVRGVYVDTEVQLDFYGAVLICTECVLEMAALLGLPTVEQWVEHIQERETWDQIRFSLKKQIAGLEAAVDGLANARGVVISERRNSDVLPSDAQGQRDIVTGADNDVSGEGTGLDRGEGASPESSDDAYLAGLRSDDGGNADGEFSFNI